MKNGQIYNGINFQKVRYLRNGPSKNKHIKLHKKKLYYRLRIAKINNKKIRKKNKLYKKIFKLNKIVMKKNNRIKNKQNRYKNNTKKFKIKQKMNKIQNKMGKKKYIIFINKFRKKYNKKVNKL